MMQSRNSQLIATSSLDTLILDPLPPETRARLLRFPLGVQDSMLLPLEQIAEILKIDVVEILPVPEMPNCVLGICNWRGEMLWLVDFNSFVGYPSLFQLEPTSTSIAVIVVQIHNQSLGLGVQQVNDIELHDLQQLQSVPVGLFPPDLLPLIRGTLPGCSDAVLDLQDIIHCPLWQKHQQGEP
ncbi:MAG: chemotaxis protein CheW [Fischerella sp.]|jgi:chemotaxis signal transduction protein|uniref:chemotaxis protein CheW n=1 Tax=Fischerella sp. TaxID=1191 RepID=UPI0017C0F9EF|nr:chemotaxis protein CheW [Fischerella sp.]NWF60421.1 chemotaxis protein CheW [Fischerella sp.]